MRKAMAAALTLLFMFGMLAGPAAAQQLPQHPHMLVIGLELDADEEPVGFRSCIDLAANQALTLRAHHENVHFGTAGFKLFTKAGHAVVPGAPFPGVPWSNCDELIAFFFGE